MVVLAVVLVVLGLVGLVALVALVVMVVMVKPAVLDLTQDPEPMELMEVLAVLEVPAVLEVMLVQAVLAVQVALSRPSKNPVLLSVMLEPALQVSPAVMDRLASPAILVVQGLMR